MEGGRWSPVVEVELCCAVSDVLKRLGFSDFIIRLNHRGLLQGMLQNCDVPDTLHEQALIAIDKKDKIGRGGYVDIDLAPGADQPGLAQELGFQRAPRVKGFNPGGLHLRQPAPGQISGQAGSR